MYVVKMMTDRKEGYREMGLFNNLAEAKEVLNAVKVYYSPIDAYFAIKLN